MEGNALRFVRRRGSDHAKDYSADLQRASCPKMDYGTCFDERLWHKVDSGVVRLWLFSAHLHPLICPFRGNSNKSKTRPNCRSVLDRANSVCFSIFSLRVAVAAIGGRRHCFVLATPEGAYVAVISGADCGSVGRGSFGPYSHAGEEIR